MKTLVSIVAILAVAILAAPQARATTYASDSFSYSDGNLPTQSGGTWANFSGGTLTFDVQVASGQASISGTRSGDDAINLSGTHLNDQIFASFDLTVSSWAPSGASSYFAMFKDSSTFNFFSRTYVTNVTGGVQIGITTSSLFPALWSPTIALGSTHNVVIGLDQTGATLASSLYIDGSLVGTTTATNFSGYSISQFALRESNAASMGSVLVDNLVVSDAVPEPSTIMLLGVGLVSLFAIRRRS